MGFLPEHSSQDHAARDAAVLACLGRGVEVVAMADDALALWWLRLVLPGLGLFPGDVLLEVRSILEGDLSMAESEVAMPRYPAWRW